MQHSDSTRADQHGRHRRGTGRPHDRLSPVQARRAVRDSRRERARRRSLALPMGLPAPLHADAVRGPGRPEVSRARGLLPHQGRDGGLSRTLCSRVLAPRPLGRAGRAPVTTRRSVPGRRRRPALRRRPRCRRDVELPEAARAAVRGSARSEDRAAALVRLPSAVATAGRRRADRRRRQFRRRDRARSLARAPPDVAGRPRRRARAVPDRLVSRAAPARAHRAARRVSPHPDGGDADRATRSTQGASRRRRAHPDEAGRIWRPPGSNACRAWRASATAGRCSRTAA